MTENQWKTPHWDERVAKIAAFIPSSVSVADFGSGANSLGAMLVDCTYTPFDLPKFDFNKNRWPDGHWDYGVLSGALEFAKDPSQVLRQLRSLCTKGVVSYQHGGSLRVRNHSGFRTHLSRAGIEQLFIETRWRYRPIGRYRSQIIYVLWR